MAKLKQRKRQQLKKNKIHQVQPFGTVIKKKSSNTFEERQANRARNEAVEARKQRRKEYRATAKVVNKNVIHKLTSWATNNPVHPSFNPRPTQEGLQKSRKSDWATTYKAYLMNLPKKVSAEELNEHFASKGISISSIRILIHGKTSKCFGNGFLEFEKRIDYEKALALNASRFKDTRILVQASLNNFKPALRRPMKMVTYNPPPLPTIPKEEPMESMDRPENDSENLDIITLS